MKNLFALLLLLISTVSFAQNGTIRGTVIEDASGQTVIGANVAIKDPLTGTSTDLDGKFSISIPEGTYELQVSFISFQTVNIKDVVVKAGEVTVIGNVRLKSNDIELGVVEITATATRKSDQALNTIKKKSATMMDGISAQKMALTGDGTAVEAAQRVTGVSIEGGKYIYVRGLGDRYSKVTLNNMDIPGLDPDKNSLQMDIFPTNLIDNILVSKNFTAELPADFTGGLVNIETKSFPDEKILSASIGISYNPDMHFNSDYLTYEGGNTDWLGFDDGTRELPSKARNKVIPSIFVNPDEEVNRFIGSFNPTLGAEKQTSFLDYSASFTIGDQIDLGKSKETTKRNPKLGYIFSLSYKNDQRYYDDVTYAEYQRSVNSNENELIYADRQEGQLATHTNLVGILGGLAYKTKLSKYRFTLMRLQNGESKAGQFQLDQNSSAVGRSGFLAGSDNLEYSQRELTNFLINGKHVLDDKGWEIDWRISPTISVAEDPDIRKTAFTFGIDTSFQAGNAGNPSRIWRELNEFSNVAKIDLTKKHKLLDEDAKFRFGASHTYKDRDYEILEYGIQFTTTQNWATNDPNLVLDPSNIFPNNTGAYIVSSVNNPNPNAYEANSSNFALYASEEFNISPSLKTIVGLRLEKFTMRHTGRDIAFSQGNGGNNLDNDKVLDGTDLFPSLNLIYSLAEEQNLRFGYSRTIARPSFKELSYAQILDPVTGRIFNGSLFEIPGDWDGNLTETFIDNIDLRWEKFMDRGQIYSVSAFYKRFKDPIELVRIPANITAFEYQPRNVGTGNLIGIELEATKSLDFLGPKFEKFSVSGNFTYVESFIKMSKSEFEARELNKRDGESIDDTRDMAGQAPYVVNFGITYSNIEKGIQSGLFYNVKGPTLLIVGTGFVPDIFQEQFHSLNWGISKKLGEEKRTSIDFKVDNILSDVRESYFDSYKAEEQIFSSINPGRSFSFGVSHKF